jgi:hypothetical protein
MIEIWAVVLDTSWPFGHRLPGKGEGKIARGDIDRRSGKQLDLATDRKEEDRRSEMAVIERWDY